MKKLPLLCSMVVLALPLLVGCASGDPWGQREKVPHESSREFRPEKDILAPARTVTEESTRVGSIGKEKMSLAESITVALENNPRTHSTWNAAWAASAGVGEEKAPTFLGSSLLQGQPAPTVRILTRVRAERESRDRPRPMTPASACATCSMTAARGLQT